MRPSSAKVGDKVRAHACYYTGLTNPHGGEVGSIREIDTQRSFPVFVALMGSEWREWYRWDELDAVAPTLPLQRKHRTKARG